MRPLLIPALLVASAISDSEEKNQCGFYSLSVCLTFLDPDFDGGALEALLNAEDAPYSLAQLERAAVRLNFSARPMRWRMKDSAIFPGACILHVRSESYRASPDHFISCLGEAGEGILVVDSQHKPFVIPRTRLAKIWDGDVLYLDSPGGRALRRIDEAILDGRLLTLTLILVGAIIVNLICIAARGLPSRCWLGGRQLR